MEELVIWVDEQDNELGRVPRTVAHDKSKLLIHRETMELLYTDRSHSKFWLQKRSEKKEQFPGLWTLSVTCHVNPGDIGPSDEVGYLTAGKREGREEMGVEVKKQELVGTMLEETEQNRAMMGIVVAEYTGNPRAEQGEIEELKLFTKETVMEVGGKLTPGAKSCLKYLGILGEDQI